MGNHLQTYVGGLEDALRQAPDGMMVKSVDDIGLLALAFNINPRFWFVYRKWRPYEGMTPGRDRADADAKADAYFASFVTADFRSKAQVVNAVETDNEVIAWNVDAETLRRLLLQERAYAERWEAWKQRYPELRHIILIHANIAVGNSVPRELAELAIEHDNAIGYHNYSLVIDGQRHGASWKYFDGRWNTQEVEEWAGQVKPKWAFTEGGPVGLDEDTGGLDPFQGWREVHVCNGNVDNYLAVMREAWGDVQQTDAYREGRILGGFGALFTTNGRSWDWPLYHTNQPELGRLNELEASMWDAPPPPPSGDGQVFVMDRNFWARQHADWGRQYRILRAGERLPLVGETTGGTFGDSNKWKVVLIEAAVHEAGGHVEGARQPELEADAAFAFSAWPTDHKYITQSYGNNPEYYGQWGLDGHEGVDLRAPEGSGIYAVADGTVIEVDDAGNYGKHVTIRHPEGYRTLYAHLSQISVVENQVVSAGDRLGDAGNTGNSSGAHLHLSLYEGERRIDPTPYLLPFKPDGYV